MLGGCLDVPPIDILWNGSEWWTIQGDESKLFPNDAHVHDDCYRLVDGRSLNGHAGTRRSATALRSCSHKLNMTAPNLRLDSKLCGTCSGRYSTKVFDTDRDMRSCHKPCHGQGPQSCH
jgi:hypothetical protein